MSGPVGGDEDVPVQGGLFGTTTGSLGDRDHALAQALADVASVALVQDSAVSDRTALAEQLQTALNSRVVLEQAKGAIAYAGGLEVGEAFQVLRRYARDHNRRLSDVAAALVDRSLATTDVIAHASARARR